MTAIKQILVVLSIAMICATTVAQTPIEVSPLSIEITPAVMIPKPVSESGSSDEVQATAENRERSILEQPQVTTAPAKVPTSTPLDNKQRLMSVNEVQTASESSASGPSGERKPAELVRQRFPNGQPQIERWVIENDQGHIVNDGPYTEYDERGEVVCSGEFVLGKREGRWQKLVSAEKAQQLIGLPLKGFSAPYRSRASFQDGQLEGDWTITDASGNTLAAWSYTAGQRQGVSAWYDSQGAVIQSITYRSNVAHGPARFSLTGEPAEEKFFTDGLMPRQVDNWYPAVAGQQRVLQSQEMQLVAAPQNIAESDWGQDIVRFRPTNTVEPIRHGLAVTFFANGQRESEGNYEHGRKTGTFAWWYANGQQMTVGEYQNDAEIGQWRWWHENGMKHATGTFVDGRRVEEWSSWSDDGKLVNRVMVEDRAQVAGRESAAGEVQKR